MTITNLNIAFMPFTKIAFFSYFAGTPSLKFSHKSLDFVLQLFSPTLAYDLSLAHMYFIFHRKLYHLASRHLSSRLKTKRHSTKSFKLIFLLLYQKLAGLHNGHSYSIKECTFRCVNL